MTTTDSNLATLLETSCVFQVDAGWLRLESESGRIPHLNAGGRLLFNLSAVEQALAERAASNNELEK